MILKEIFNSIKSSFNERINSPLIGSFIISWCIINWDILLFLFAPKKNLDELTTVIMKVKQEEAITLYIIPILLSITYVLIGPWITLWVNKFREIPIQKSRIDKIISETAYQNERIGLIEAQARSDVAKNNILLDTRNKEIDAEKRELEIKGIKEDFDNKFEELRKEKKELEKIRSDIEPQQSKLKTEESKALKPEEELNSKKEISPKEDNSTPESKKQLDESAFNNSDMPFQNESEKLIKTATTPTQDNAEYFLSEEAKILLKTASSQGDGTIIHVAHLGGRSIQVGSEQFGSEQGREIAKWEDALNLLVKLNFVVDRGSKGEVFELTHLGWSEADKL